MKPVFIHSSFETPPTPSPDNKTVSSKALLQPDNETEAARARTEKTLQSREAIVFDTLISLSHGTLEPGSAMTGPDVETNPVPYQPEPMTSLPIPFILCQSDLQLICICHPL